MTAMNSAESWVKNQIVCCNQCVQTAKASACKLHDHDGTFSILFDCPVTDEAKSLDNIATKRSALQAKAADVEANIRNLGSLPAEAFEKYKQTGVKVGHLM